MRAAQITGRALLWAFIATIGLALLPLELGSPDWGRRVSTLIVDASSLPLVGLLLLRYVASQDNAAGQGPARQEDQEPDGNGQPGGNAILARINPFRFQFSIARVAYAGFVGLLLLAIWQVMLWVTGLDALESQGLHATVRIQSQSKAMEQRFSQAPDDEIGQAWMNLESSKAPVLGDPSPSLEAKRKDLLDRIHIEEKLALKNADEVVNKQRFLLTRDIVRIVLIAIIYAWAFYGIAKL